MGLTFTMCQVILLLSVEFQSQGGDGKGDIQYQKSHEVPGMLYL